MGHYALSGYFAVVFGNVESDPFPLTGFRRDGRGTKIERIDTQLAEMSRVDGERKWQEQKEEGEPHG